MRIRFLLFIFLSAGCMRAAAQRDSDFNKRWLGIDTLIVKDDLTRTTIEKVKQLYTAARNEHRQGDMIRSLMYLSSLEEKILPDSPNRVIAVYRRELSQAADPAVEAVLHSLLARQYQHYFMANRWQLYNRKQAADAGADISVWSADDFTRAIIFHLQASLRNAALLQQVAIRDYETLIIKGKLKDATPTLFDLLANETLSYTKTAQNFTRSAAAFVMDDPALFAPAETFLRASFATQDSTDSRWMTLRVYQQLLSFHQHDAIPDNFIRIDIDRLEWLKTSGTPDQDEGSYNAALRYAIDRYGQSPASARAWLLLARNMQQEGKNYSPFGDTTYRYQLDSAVSIIDGALRRFAATNADTAEMAELRSSILSKRLFTQLENMVIPGIPVLAVANYRNTEALYARVIDISGNESLFSRRSQADLWKYVTTLPVLRRFQQALPIDTDHQLHRAQFKMDALPAGEYVLLTSSGENFTDSVDNLSVNFFQVTRIAYVKRGTDFFVMDRETGAPMANVQATIIQSPRGDRKTFPKNDTTGYHTDQHGYFRTLHKGAGAFLRFDLRLENDRLVVRNPPYEYDPETADRSVPSDDVDDYEKDHERVFFFTDRSIYRPGQTVYFKGIALTEDAKTKLSKLIKRKVQGWTYLEDVNNKRIDSVSFNLNDFGSFNGKFTLPQNVLTGRFTIGTDVFDSNTGFSVEEYKRPQFDVQLINPKQAYRLGDSVSVTGTARAFAGNTLDGAKVKYTVTREQHYSFAKGRPLIFAARDVARGEIVADGSGNFSIRFKALAPGDKKISPDARFTFEVTATVTDISGETHDRSLAVVAASHSLQLSTLLPLLSEADSLHDFTVNATNLAGEKQSAQVSVSFYKLKTPAHSYRKRYWERPDQFVMTETEFHRYFPNDEYANESSKENMPVEKKVFSADLFTGNTSRVKIPAGALTAGIYKVETKTVDRNGDPVSFTNFIELYNGAKQQLPYKTFAFYGVAQAVVEPLSTVDIPLGTDAPAIFVTRRIFHPRTALPELIFEKHSAGLHHFIFRPKESDRGVVRIEEWYVMDNRLYSREQNIFVPWHNKELEITYSSFRNKVEPGSKETWTVSVKGDKKQAVVAELLTTMYDASLDKLQPHTWNVPGIWPLDVVSRYYNSDNIFGATIASENYVALPSIHHVAMAPSRLAHSGEELWNDSFRRWLTDPSVNFAAIAKERPHLDEVVVTAISARKSMTFTGAVATFAGTVNNSTILRISGAAAGNGVLYIVDGKEMSSIESLAPDEIAGINTLSPDQAARLYGARGANGVVIISTKNGIAGPPQAPLQVRKNFTETAFFFPALHADANGDFHFTFAMPESLTQWKWLSLAHTKDLSFGFNQAAITTQKQLMVQPNVPRFVREGDNMEFAGKVVNLSDKEITGQASLELIDPSTNTPVDGWFQNVFPSQYFTVEPGKSFALKFPVQIPFSYNKPLQWRMVARAGQYSDGEENTLPVLTNRMLVTETLPLYAEGDTAMHVYFNKLLHNNSESLTHQALTVEYTSNPAWYAVQSLPYLIEFPYECAEQTFNRLFANSLSSYILHSSPRIQSVMEKWRKDSAAVLSSLDKNPELKQLLIQETPWALEAQSESQQKKRLAELLDTIAALNRSVEVVKKLKDMQQPDGSFSWFSGGAPDLYITQYILTGIGKLNRLHSLPPALEDEIKNIAGKALAYTDAQVLANYKRARELSNTSPGLYASEIEYLYMRSFFAGMPLSDPAAFDHYLSQAKLDWVKQNYYYRAMLGIVFLRNNEQEPAIGKILSSLLENAVEENNIGMYWKDNHTRYWFTSPVEMQSMMINFVSEVSLQKNDRRLQRQLYEMRTWLLNNKRTTHWGTTIATADACYALLQPGTNWLDAEKTVNIQLGALHLSSSEKKQEAGTGYFKKIIDGNKVDSTMGDISLSIHTRPASAASPSWGSVYWQYFEDMDKITPSASPLSVVKKLYVERNNAGGVILAPVNENDELRTGDKIIVRMELRSDRDMDYLHLKDLRAAAMEPANVLSGYRYNNGLGYYESTRDASTHFFIDHLAKGIYVFDYPLTITQTGIFSVGTASIECMYAPEFASHSASMKIRVRNPD